MPTPSSEFLTMWNPEVMTNVQRFHASWRSTYQFNQEQQQAIAGAESYLERARLLAKLIPAMRPFLDRDYAELEVRGYTPAEGSRQVAAVFESALVSLYSALDCTHAILKLVFRGWQGLGRQTPDMLRNATANALDSRFPDGFARGLRTADGQWFQELRTVRNAAVHRQGGHVGIDRAGGQLDYYNTALPGEDGRVFVQDVDALLARQQAGVADLVDAAFGVMCDQLVGGEIVQHCGMASGRVYQRRVDALASDWNAGVCLSKAWFDAPEEPRCPRADDCGAYLRAVGTSSSG